MAILWRRGMSVANDVIDHDHHFMINFINTIELVLQKPEEKEMLMEVLDQLHEYSINHFRREETIQRKIEYPQSLNHRNSHSTLLADLEKLIGEIKESKSTEEISERSPEIINFLRNWLINHVLNEDIKLKPYLEKLPKAFS
ncbi:MAG: bacteriohemerythrin [Melioribacteraceae bacterium]|nr:bacteriohemerythrin [Melioribacteraceae bacterium]